MMVLLGWVPLLAMHGGRLVQASSGATFILTGLCASFAAAALSYRWLRPRGISGLSALLVFLSTAVAGVSLLLAFQWCAEFTLKHGPVYAGKATVWIWIIQFAGKCYAWSGSADFFKQTVGCVFGIGVCEELTKILPLAVVLFTGYAKPLAGRTNYRAFVALGFLSGLAFGISEALVVYSPWAQTLQIDDSGMGVLGTPITSGLNRWFSCVPMHALWGAADAAVLWLLSTRLLSAKSPLAKFGILILATMAMAVVHGLYDAACFRGSYAGIVLGIGSVFLVQWIVAHSAASSDPVPAKSSGCERPLEMFFRLPYAIALTAALALFGLGALYWVSIPLSSGSPLIGSEQSLPPLDREALALANSEFEKVLMTSDDSWFTYDTKDSRYVEIKGLKLEVKPSKLSEADVLNGIEWVGDVNGTYRVQRLLSIYDVKLEWGEWTGAGSLLVVHCKKVRGRWLAQASDLERLSVFGRHSVFVSAMEIKSAEKLASLLPKKLGDKLRADIQKERADIETVRQAKIANLLEGTWRRLTSEPQIVELNQLLTARNRYESVLQLDSNNAAAKAGLLEVDKAKAEFVKRGVESSQKIRAATKEAPWVNSLGMMFVPVPIADRTAYGVKVLFSVWNTRKQDYNAFHNRNDASRAGGSVDEGATYPILLNLEDAREFCERLTVFEQMRGIIGFTERYTLPSDHWWSCAAAIGNREDPDASPKDKSGKITDVHPWGRGWPPPKDARNYVNEYGLHDMGGGVWQWCDTLFDPPNDRDRLLNTSSWKSDAFVLRGGVDYSGGKPVETLSSRNYKQRLSHEGFRCVLVSGRDSPR
jgi:RsiW-degrading membrane proteinase PrsW (M82 family)